MGKINLGVSSCLLGNRVRYDGGHKKDPFITETLGRQFGLLPVCPEVECGLPVPREAMQLVGETASPRLITIETRIDRTDRLLQWADEELVRLAGQDIRGFVFKARSPSCAVCDAEVVAPSGEPKGKAPGLFVRAFTRRFASLPIIDEEQLAVPAVRDGFLELVRVSRPTI